MAFKLFVHLLFECIQNILEVKKNLLYAKIVSRINI